MSIINSNQYPNELLQNTSTIDPNFLDTQGLTNQILVIDNNGQSKWSDPNNLQIQVDQLQPSSSTQDVLITNSNNEIQWTKLQDANILNLATSKLTGQIDNSQLIDNNINQSKIISLPFSKITDTTNTITNDMLQDNTITQQKIISLPAEKITGLIQDDQIEDLDFNKLLNTFDAIETDMLQDNCVTDDKINDVNYNKLTNKDNQIQNSHIQNTQITPAKMNIAKNGRQLFVDATLGVNSAEYGSQLKPYQSLQYALDQVTSNGYIINVMTSLTENILIDGKNQLVIKYNNSEVQNSSNLEHSGKFTIQNSNSIKIVNIQINATSLVNEHALTLISGNNYFKNMTILADSGYGVYIGKDSLYNQFQHVECELYYQQDQSPTQTNLQLFFENCQINNNITNIMPYYTLAIDNSLVVGTINFSQGNIQIYNSSIYQNLTFSSISPQVMILVDCRFIDASLNLRSILKSGTGLYVLQNCIYNQATSTFSGTRLYQMYTSDSDIPVNTISLSKLKNGTPNKYLQYNGSGVLAEVDISTVVNFNELQGSLANSQIPAFEITSNKLAQDFTNANKFWKYGADGYLTFVTQSTTVDWNNIQNFPDVFPSYRFLDASGNPKKVSYYDFDSSNALNVYGDGQKLLYTMNYIDAEIQQQRFYNMDDLISFVSNNTISFDKMLNQNGAVTNNALYCKIGGSNGLYKITKTMWDAVKQNEQIISWQDLVRDVLTAPTDTQILSYDAASGKLKFVDQPSGGGGGSLPSQTGNANKVLKTDGTNASWTLVDYPNMNIIGGQTPTAQKRCLRYNTNNGGMVYEDYKMDYTNNVYPGSARQAFIADYYAETSNGASGWSTCPLYTQYLSSGYPTNLIGSMRQCINYYPITNYALDGSGYLLNAFSGYSPSNQLIGFGHGGFLILSASVNNVALKYLDADIISGGNNHNGGFLINTSGNATAFSDERRKKDIKCCDQKSLDTCYSVLDQISVKKFKYNWYDDGLLKCQQKQCDCKDTKECHEKQARLWFKSRNNYGFIAQEIEKTPLKCINESFEKQHDIEEYEAFKQTCCPELQAALEEKKKEIFDKEYKMITRENMIMPMWNILKKMKQINQEQDAKIQQLQTQLNSVLEILQRNNIQ